MARPKEIWKDILGFEGSYQVSNLGRVRSVRRTTLVCNVRRNNNIRRDESWVRKSRIIQPVCCGKMRNFEYVHLYKDGKRFNKSVKRLVAEAFLDTYFSELPTANIRLKDKSKGCNASNLYIV